MRIPHVVILVSAVLAITGYYGGKDLQWLVYVFKPLTTVLILLVALQATTPDRRYRRFIVAGLVFSLAGDVFLMLPGDFFIQGLLGFLAAHVCYLVAFTSGIRLAERATPFVVLGCIAAGILAVLWPALPGAIRIPVLVYVALLTMMSAQSVARHVVLKTPASRYAAAGGVAFLVSDATLAIDRFRFPFGAASAAVLATYYLSQVLIARSIETPRKEQVS